MFSVPGIDSTRPCSNISHNAKGMIVLRGKHRARFVLKPNAASFKPGKRQDDVVDISIVPIDMSCSRGISMHRETGERISWCSKPDGTCKSFTGVRMFPRICSETDDATFHVRAAPKGARARIIAARAILKR